MFIFEYIFVHAQRLKDKKLVRKINTHHWAKSKISTNNKTQKEQTDDLRAASIEGELKKSMKLYQKGLGIFNKLVVRDG